MNKLETIRTYTYQTLQNGQLVSIGSWMQIANSSVAEIMGQAGYDWVTLSTWNTVPCACPSIARYFSSS